MTGGFGVVAQEVSKLAERTLASLKESNDILKNSKSVIERTKSNLSATSDVLKNLVQEVGDSSDKSTEILKQQTLLTEKLTTCVDKDNACIHFCNSILFSSETFV